MPHNWHLCLNEDEFIGGLGLDDGTDVIGELDDMNIDWWWTPLFSLNDDEEDDDDDDDDDDEEDELDDLLDDIFLLNEDDVEISCWFLL